MSGERAAAWSQDLAGAVFDRLRVLDQIAAGVRRRLTAPELTRIREEIAGLVEAWRRLLIVHARDERGRCSRCRGWFLRRRWPCRVWQTAHDYLITSGVAVAEPAVSVRARVPRGALSPGRAAASGAESLRARPGPVVVVRARLGGAR